jgi:Golgi apparatus protein 1
VLPGQDYRDELAGPECRKQVHVLTQRATQDIRFDEPLADACYEDRARLCDGVQPVRPLLHTPFVEESDTEL